MASKPPDAFLSYTRFDDQHSGGAISKLRLRLESTVRAVTGEPFEIFQDVDGIGLGEHWPGKLDQMLDQVRFFIPIMTPSYFKSRACREELEKFLKAERDRNRNDLVLPIYYIECDVLDDAEHRVADPLATAMHERQRYNWCALRHHGFSTRKVKTEIERLAREIRGARRRVATAPAMVVDQTVTSPTQHSGIWSRPAIFHPGRVFRDIDAPWCPELVVIPAGRFVMGSPKDEGGRTDAEGPQHEVRFARPFALGRYPVTFEEYDHFCTATGRAKPNDQGWGRARRPVIDVSWDDAQAYCAWLGERAGQPYRLPSEAEWEYACRAGTTTPFWTGATISTEQANYGGNYTDGPGGEGQYREHTTPVDTFPANPWGLYDMPGNVWEWCQDCWNVSYKGAPADGSPWLQEGCSYRVIRGGSFQESPSDLRSAFRIQLTTDSRDFGLGFRGARTLPPCVFADGRPRSA